MEKDSRVAFVTGGASGIGRAIVLHFSAHGYSTVVADVDQERGRQLEQELKAQGRAVHFIATDVRNENSIQEAIQHTIDEYGRMDVLVNNAGIERYRAADEYTSEDWQAVHETNLRGSFFCSKYAAPHLKQTRGNIVIISSVQAFATEKDISIYAATKSGLLGLARGMALDFAGAGVRVNCICPGAIHTGMIDSALKDEPDMSAAISAIGQKIPLGRIGQPEDIARAAFFLASDEASYITGTTLVVDGGLLSRLAL